MNDNYLNNQRLLNLLSQYLNKYECSINKSQITKVCSHGVDELTAYKLLLACYLNVDEDRKFTDLYFDKMIHLLNEEDYINNPYYKNIKFNNQKINSWQIKTSKYKAYELFVCDDFKYEGDLLIPQLGFFNKPFNYLAVYDNNRLWMSITPNEINTMKGPIENAKGNVLTFGLGLGYFAYMCSLKEEVKSITIIEKDSSVIKLFKEHILNQFEYKYKINIIQEDAYTFLKTLDESLYDYAFVDIYHDASDGKQTYLNFKEYVNKYKTITFEFWIYQTIKYYL